MTIIERALELVSQHSLIGLGSGRAAQAFVRALGEKVRSGAIRVCGVPTSDETASLARKVGIPLSTLADAPLLDVTVDGADEVDPSLDLIKGYGRAMVREKVVATSSRSFVVLVGKEKLVSQLGTRGKLPVEVLPFALPTCQRKLQELGCRPMIWAKNGHALMTDNGNYILDCIVEPIADTTRLESSLRAIPGVVGTGLFLEMAHVVLVGSDETFELIDERRRA